MKRLARILPLAYLYTFFVYTFVFFDPRAALWTSTFLINYFDAYFVDGLNAHFWSLCVEMQFYFAIALVILLGGKRAIWVVFPTCLLITGIRIHDGAYIAIQTHLRVDEILAGACVALIYEHSSNWRIPFRTPLAVVTAVLWFLSSSPWMFWFQYFETLLDRIILSCNFVS